jgi:cytochrome b6-f complex iron-sulfur subunit
LIGLWGVGIIAGVASFLRPPRHQHRRNELVVPAADVQTLGLGQALLLPHDPDPIHLVRLTEVEFVAVSASCTHLRCVLEFEAEDRSFVCPCHRGHFDLNGNVIAGLPRTPLRRYRTKYRFGEVVIEIT